MRSEIEKAQMGRGRRIPRQRRYRHLLQSEAFLSATSFILHGMLTFIHATTRFVPESDDFMAKSEGYRPVIFAMWHGQQFLIPFHRPREAPVTALTSRSADAEINARVLERNGVRPFEASGEDFDPQRQTAARRVETADPEQVGRIADRIRPGFKQGTVVLQKERVAVYVAALTDLEAQPAAETEDRLSAASTSDIPPQPES